LVHSGEEYFVQLVKIIDNATQELHLQTYHFENDTTGKTITAALIAAAQRKVKIFVLLDGFGSNTIDNEFIKTLSGQGIHIRFFSPLFSANSFYLGRRLHHKIVVADNRTTLIGGINIADKYSGIQGVAPWLDYAIKIENTALATSVQLLCHNIYDNKKRFHNQDIKKSFQLNEGTSIKISRNDWLKRVTDISKSYIHEIRNAEKEIVIIGSYFLPGRRLIQALKTAAKKGVKIKLILAGLSDLELVKRSTSFLYATLLEQKIELYEWNGSILHAKVAIIDHKWTTIGSFNINHLSSYGSIEMNVEIQSTKFANDFEHELTSIIQQCVPITLETIKFKNGLFTNLINWVAYRTTRFILIVLTYVPYNRFHSHQLFKLILL